MDTKTLIIIVFNILMFFTVTWFSFGLFRYIQKYNIFELYKAKFLGNINEYDRIRRRQVRLELEEKENTFQDINKKTNRINQIYALIGHAGILEKIPSFSEAGFLLIISSIAILLVLIFSFIRNITVGFIIGIAFIISIIYILNVIAYNRKTKLESQLLQFANACASASLQYSNIIDIMGSIYDQFTYPLREGLELCYVEAKQTNNKSEALRHLKDRYNSTQFSFVIDNMELCSNVTGDFHSTTQDISKTISIYSTSHEKRIALLRNAKVTIVVMFLMSLVILWALDAFLGGISNILLTTTIGNISIIALILVFLYGMNIKAD